jgi:hypothetical protein
MTFPRKAPQIKSDNEEQIVDFDKQVKKRLRSEDWDTLEKSEKMLIDPKRFKDEKHKEKNAEREEKEWV